MNRDRIATILRQHPEIETIGEVTKELFKRDVFAEHEQKRGFKGLNKDK